MNSYSAAMFYSFQQNNEVLLEDMAMDMKTGKFYISDVYYDKSQLGVNSQSLRFNTIKIGRNIQQFLGEYCIEGVVATNIAAMTKIISQDDQKMKIFSHIFFAEFVKLNGVPNNSNIQNKSHVIHDMTNYMFLRIKTMKQEKNNKNYKDIDPF